VWNCLFLFFDKKKCFLKDTLAPSRSDTKTALNE